MSEKKTIDKEALKKLRQERRTKVEKAQQTIKSQNQIVRQIKAQITGEPKTIPEIARGADMPTSQVLLYISGLKHYGVVAEAEKDGDYFKYRLIP